jgi:hydrogenase maturation protease
MNEWEWQLLEDRIPTESVRVAGVDLKKGDRVRLRPRRRGDVMDSALSGRAATIEAIEQDYEGALHLSVVIDGDPGCDLGAARQPAHRFFFRPDEVEPAGPAVAPARILIAGIGNIFFGDDAFGVEVARRLESGSFPDGVRVIDFGIRGYDLAYALTSGYEAAILVDAMPRGGAPGTLYLIQPDPADLENRSLAAAAPDAHSMEPLSILRMAKSTCELPRRTFVLGCEPAALGGEEGRMGLSPEVASAVDRAIARLKSLVAEIRATEKREK